MAALGLLFGVMQLPSLFEDIGVGEPLGELASTNLLGFASPLVLIALGLWTVFRKAKV